jgi:coenzyme F420-reducing hydrogenase alpha subunit
VALMPPPQADALLESIEPAIREQDDFPATPHWRGEPRETGALARAVRVPLVAELQKSVGNIVALRFAARLAELAEMPRHLRDGGERSSWLGAVSPRPGWGLAWVECARGLLLHQVWIEEGEVARYRIVAPTEWNFHPDGPLVKGLRGVAAASEAAAKSRATAMVQALDPCVAYEIEVHHA